MAPVLWSGFLAKLLLGKVEVMPQTQFHAQRRLHVAPVVSLISLSPCTRQEQRVFVVPSDPAGCCDAAPKSLGARGKEHGGQGPPWGLLGHRRQLWMRQYQNRPRRDVVVTGGDAAKAHLPSLQQGWGRSKG